jgi:hypothetical protein
VVFREDSEFGALGGGGADERTCFLEVMFGLEGLVCVSRRVIMRVEISRITS